MKYVKMLGLLAVAAAALMAFVGSASAATLTSPEGTQLGVGSVIKAESSNTSLDGSVQVACGKSTVEGSITGAGGVVEGKTQSVSGTISKLTFTECGNDTVEVTKEGKLDPHGGLLSINSAGEVFSTGAEVTVKLHRIIFFVPVTTHCIYKTGNTKVGTLIESGAKDTNGKTTTTATLDIGSSPIPEVETDGACGNDAVWTGTYTVTSPDHLYVD